MATDTEEDYKLFKIGRRFNWPLPDICYEYVVARNYNSALQLWQDHYRNSMPGNTLPDSVSIVSRKVIL